MVDFRTDKTNFVLPKFGRRCTSHPDFIVLESQHCKCFVRGVTIHLLCQVHQCEEYHSFFFFFFFFFKFFLTPKFLPSSPPSPQIKLVPGEDSCYSASAQYFSSLTGTQTVQTVITADNGMGKSYLTFNLWSTLSCAATYNAGGGNCTSLAAGFVQPITMETTLQMEFLKKNNRISIQ